MSNTDNNPLNLPDDPDELAKRMQEDYAKRREILSDEEAKEIVWVMHELAQIVVDSKFEEIKEKNHKQMLEKGDVAE